MLFLSLANLNFFLLNKTVPMPRISFLYSAYAVLCKTPLYFANTLRCHSMLCRYSTVRCYALPLRFITFPHCAYANSSAFFSTTPLHYLAKLRFVEADHYLSVPHLCFTYHNSNQPCRSLFRDFSPFETTFT